MEQLTFLRIQGTWRTNKSYKPRPGLETIKIPDCAQKTSDPNAPCNLQLVLLDKESTELWTGTPVLRGGQCSSPDAWTLSGYIPLLPAADAYEIRYHSLVVYRSPIVAEPPRVRIHACKVYDDKAHISWQPAQQGGNYFYSLACLLDQRTFPLALHLRGQETTLDMARLPGHKQARLALRISDGVRSSVELSEPFDIPEKPPIVTIQEPAPDQSFAATQPVSLVGQVRDVTGRALAPQQMSWWLDEQWLANGQEQLVLTNLDQGRHLIRLVYTEKQVVTEAVVYVTVEPLQDWEKEWQDMMSGKSAATPYQNYQDNDLNTSN